MDPRIALRAALRALPRPLGKWLYLRLRPRLARRGPCAVRCGPAGSRFRIELDFAEARAERPVRRFFFRGRLERHVEGLVLSLLRPGAVVLDVGANWGYYALLAARRVGPRGRVIAFEPEPENLARMDRNLALNPDCAVTVEPLAVADRPGELAFHIGRTTGTGSLLAGSRYAAGPALRVRATTLDAYLDAQGLARADVVKMDIEGGEVAAIEGMAAGLAAGRYGHIVLEWHGSVHADLGGRPRAALQRLAEAGYALLRVGKRRRRPKLDPVEPGALGPERVHLYCRPPGG